MSWPLSSEFNEAVQNPRVAFADPDLRDAEAVVGATGLPLPHSGNFADVYQLRAAGGRAWAVKCFTRPVPGLADRYARISAALAAANLPFAVGFAFLAEGVRVGGAWRPVVKMEWVEGLLLNQVARDSAAKPTVLSALSGMWAKLCKRLREAGVAHADLQHGNVLLVPGARPGAYGLKLIDYDGVWVPALANTPSGESGHPAFQHPARAATRAYSPDVDRFPHLVIATALAALEVGGAALWGRYDNGDNLLFTEADFKAPAASPLFRELWELRSPKVRALVGRLAVACVRPLPQTPWLDQFAPDGEPAPLDADTRAAAAALGMSDAGVVPIPVPVPVEVKVAPKPATKEKPALAPGQPAERVRKPIVERRPDAGRKLLLPLLAVGAVVLCAAVVGAVLAFRPKPAETVQQPTDDGATKPKDAVAPKPKEPPVPPVPKPKDPVVVPVPKPKPKDKEPDPVPPKPKDPPRVPEPVVLRPRWSVPAATDGAPAALHADDAAVLVGGARTSLLTFDPATGAKRPAAVWLPLTGGDNFCPLARGLVAWCAPDDTEVRTWDVRAAKAAGKYPVPELPPGKGAATHTVMRLSPDARHLAVARAALALGGGAEVPLRVVEAGKDGKTVVDTTWTGGSIHFTPDAERVLVAGADGWLRRFDLATGKVDAAWTFVAPTAGRTHRVTGVSADGGVIGYTGPANGATATPCLVDGRTGKVLHRFEAGYAADSPVAVAATGRVAAVRRKPDGPDVTVEVVSVPKGDVIARATLTTEAVPTFALSADGRALVVHDPKAGTLRRFDLP